MKLLLSLCFLLTVTSAFDAPKCAFSFTQNISKILSLKQVDLVHICAAPVLRTQTVGVLKGILSDCGLNNWINGNNLDIQAGAMLQGLFAFFEHMLCSTALGNVGGSGYYCFPHAIRLVSISKFLQLNWNNIDWSALDVKCSIMNEPTLVNQICPHGGINSPQYKCKNKMVQLFDMAVGIVKSMLGNYLPEKIKSTVMPLLDFAVDVRMMCKKDARMGVMAYFQKKCAGETPEDTTDMKLKSEFCYIDPQFPGKNHVKKEMQAWLAVGTQYDATVTLPNGVVITEDYIQKLCCAADCMKQRNQFINSFKSTTEIEMSGVDLWTIYYNMNAEQKENLHQAICADKASIEEFGSKDCKAIISKGYVRQSRRLLTSSTSVIATLDVNTTDTSTPFTCQNSGSFYSFDSQFTNSTTQSTQKNCNCSGTCKEIVTSMPTQMPTSPPTNKPQMSTSSPTSQPTSNGLMKSASLSFVVVFYSFFFIL